MQYRQAKVYPEENRRTHDAHISFHTALLNECTYFALATGKYRYLCFSGKSERYALAKATWESLPLFQFCALKLQKSTKTKRCSLILYRLEVCIKQTKKYHYFWIQLCWTWRNITFLIPWNFNTWMVLGFFPQSKYFWVIILYRGVIPEWLFSSYRKQVFSIVGWHLPSEEPLSFKKVGSGSPILWIPKEGAHIHPPLFPKVGKETAFSPSGQKQRGKLATTRNQCLLWQEPA